MDTNDKELFDSALTDEPVETVEAEAPEQAQQVEGQTRDEQGRFAARQEPEAAATPEPQGKDEAHVPSWRLREEREAREAADRRFNEAQAQWQRQFQELQSRLPKQEPKPAPDVFENPNEFLQHGVQQAIDPLRSEINGIREQFSRMYAVDKFGEEKVSAAYSALDQAAKAGDPDAVAVCTRVRSSMTPFQDIMKWHDRQTVISQVGSDPNAWFDKELERRMADPQFASAQLQKIQAGVRQQPSGNTIKLPPSIGKVPSSQSASDDAGDMSDGSLFAHALR